MLVAEMIEGRNKLAKIDAKLKRLEDERDRLRLELAFTLCPTCGATTSEKVSVCTACGYDAGDEP